jgi:hypothetical protein
MASKEIEVLDPTATVEKLKNLASRRAMNRRNFVTALGVTGAAAGAGLVSSRTPARPSTVSALGPAQTDYLNFLLNIKYLEATYYSYITQGADLPISLTAASGTMYQPPAKVTFPTQQITDLVNEIYYDELSHVIGLRNILGAAAVNRPAMNLQGLNTTASTTAVTVTPAAALGTIRLFEDVGVTAINYLAEFLTSNYLTSAAQILAAEAFHAGALRLIVIQQADALVPPAYLSFSGVITSGSPTITNVSNTAGLIVGATLIGTGIASGAKIAAINIASEAFGTGTITMSANANASTTTNATTLIGTNTPSDGLDVEPVDPGAAQVSALATSGPLLVTGTSNPPIYEGFFNTASIANGTETTPAGFAFARTTGQVLTILYSTYAATSYIVALPGAAKGGYFPLGVTGAINSIPTQG